MANLFSQYSSGLQFTAGTIVGSSLGTSGLNAIVDRLNSISSSDNLIIGSLISGTSTQFYGDGQGNFIGSFYGILSGTSITDLVTRVDSISISNGILASGVIATGHGSEALPMIINVAYGAGSTPPTIGSVVEGTLYIQYIV